MCAKKSHVAREEYKYFTRAAAIRKTDGDERSASKNYYAMSLITRYSNPCFLSLS